MKNIRHTPTFYIKILIFCTKLLYEKGRCALNVINHHYHTSQASNTVILLKQDSYRITTMHISPHPFSFPSGLNEEALGNKQVCTKQASKHERRETTPKIPSLFEDIGANRY